MTTEDLVELSYWDDALAEKVHKHESRVALIREVISKLKKEIFEK